jgi:hypothetical protein
LLADYHLKLDSFKAFYEARRQLLTKALKTAVGLALDAPSEGQAAPINADEGVQQ